MFTTALSNMFITLERHAETYSDTELSKVKVFLSKKTKNDLLQAKQQASFINYRLARRAQVNKNMQDQTKVKISVKKDLSTIVRT